eukprot:scaffold23287_cov175-Amphora_coffeaeformis.AAC.7
MSVTDNEPVAIDRQGTSSIQQTGTESASQTAWGTLTGMTLLLIFVVFCGTLLLLYYQKKQTLQVPTAWIDPAVPAPTTSDGGYKNDDQEATCKVEPIVDAQISVQQLKLDTKPSFWAFLIMGLSAMVAFLFSILTHTSCELMDTEDDSNFLSLGLWSVALAYDGATGTGGDGFCYSSLEGHVDGRNDFDDFEVDASLKVARAAGLVATVLGGVFILSLILAVVVPSFMPQRRLFRPWFLVTLLVTSFCQLLSLVVASGDTCDTLDCRLGFGGLWAIVSGAYWLCYYRCGDNYRSIERGVAFTAPLTFLLKLLVGRGRDAKRENRVDDRELRNRHSQCEAFG